MEIERKRNSRQPPCQIVDKWYKIEVLNNEKWFEVGEEEETRKEIAPRLRTYTSMGDTVRLVEHFHGFRQVGRIYKPRRKLRRK